MVKIPDLSELTKKIDRHKIHNIVDSVKLAITSGRQSKPVEGDEIVNKYDDIVALLQRLAKAHMDQTHLIATIQQKVQILEKDLESFRHVATVDQSAPEEKETDLTEEPPDEREKK